MAEQSQMWTLAIVVNAHIKRSAN